MMILYYVGASRYVKVADMCEAPAPRLERGAFLR